MRLQGLLGILVLSVVCSGGCSDADETPGHELAIDTADPDVAAPPDGTLSETTDACFGFPLEVDPNAAQQSSRCQGTVGCVYIGPDYSDCTPGQCVACRDGLCIALALVDCAPKSCGPQPEVEPKCSPELCEHGTACPPGMARGCETSGCSCNSDGQWTCMPDCGGSRRHCVAIPPTMDANAESQQPDP